VSQPVIPVSPGLAQPCTVWYCTVLYIFLRSPSLVFQMRLTPLPAHAFSSASSPIPLAGEPKGLSATSSAGAQAPLLLVATVKGLQLFQGDTLLATHPLPFEPSAAALHPGASRLRWGRRETGSFCCLRLGRGECDVKTGTLERHRGPITALCFSPDGAFLASGDQNREAVVWNCATKEVRTPHPVSLPCKEFVQPSLSSLVSACIYSTVLSLLSEGPKSSPLSSPCHTPPIRSVPHSRLPAVVRTPRAAADRLRLVCVCSSQAKL